MTSPAIDGTRLGRELSYAVVLFHEAVGLRLGLSAVDHKHLDLIDREGPVSAGRLAELTGLSTGAVTHLVDRLAARRYVRRISDPADRRRVLIQADPATSQTVGPLFGSLIRQADALLAGFKPEQRRAIADYLQAMTRLLESAAAELRGEDVT